MDKPVAYQGKEPYIFISYAHKDAYRVLPLVTKMQQDGFRVWYDEGITPGDEWDDNIAEHLVKCNYFIAFLSQKYLDSENCKDEMYYAFDLNKPQMMVYLEAVELPQRMEFRIGRGMSIVADRKGRFLKKVYQQKPITVCHNRSKILRRRNFGRRIAAVVITFALGLSMYYGYRQINFEELQYQIEEYLYPKELQKSILFRKNGITVVARGIEVDEAGNLKIQLFLENTTEYLEWLYLDDIKINGTEVQQGAFRLDPHTSVETDWIIPAEYMLFSGLEQIQEATDVKMIEAVLHLSENGYKAEINYYPYGIEYAMRKR